MTVGQKGRDYRDHMLHLEPWWTSRTQNTPKHGPVATVTKALSMGVFATASPFDLKLYRVKTQL